jgi:hypothetical protein
MASKHDIRPAYPAGSLNRLARTRARYRRWMSNMLKSLPNGCAPCSRRQAWATRAMLPGADTSAFVSVRPSM